MSAVRQSLLYKLRLYSAMKSVGESGIARGESYLIARLSMFQKCTDSSQLRVVLLSVTWHR